MKINNEFLKTTTFRLTVWFITLFTTLTVLVFGVIYYLLSLHLHEKTDRELLLKARYIKDVYYNENINSLKDKFLQKIFLTKESYFQVIDSSQKIVTTSVMPKWYDTSVIKLNDKKFKMVYLKGNYHNRKVRILSSPINENYSLLIAQKLDTDEIILERYRETFSWAVFMMILGGSLIGFFVVKKTLNGVVRVSHTAKEIGESFDKRVAYLNEGTEINELVTEFNLMLERVDKLVHNLSEITDNIAHELRTPITRIKGVAETTLLGSGTKDEYADSLSSIIESSDELVNMINTMLDITKTGSGVEILNIEKVDIDTLTKSAVEIFQVLASDKNISLKFESYNNEIFIDADKNRMQRVLSNLIDNAIKYNKTSGKVFVTLEKENGTITVTVEDTGIGIAKDSLNSIFDRFYREENSRSSNGNGLGLSLVKAIVNAHGWSIDVESEVGIGSLFRINI